VVAVVRGVAVAFGEFRALYTIRSWLFGWCLRLVFQVVFFSSVGILIGGRSSVDYLLIGNVVAVAALESTSVVVSMSREKWYGTLPLLIAQPIRPAAVILACSANWPVTAMLSAGVTMAVSLLIFHLPVAIGDVLLAVPLIFVCAVSSFAFGSAVGAVVLRKPSIGFTCMNICYLGIMTFTGVNVPVNYWSPVVGWIAQLLPVTHGLRAVRAVLAGNPSPAILTDVLLELGVGALWLTVAVILLNRFVRHARRDGGLDFS
jgi:ABC-2 type transport system permease protein